LATFLLWRFSRSIKLDFRHLCDAAAPALLLAYGIGRLGCQVSGDGDWGIFNSAYATNQQGLVVKASLPFDSVKVQYREHLQRHFEPGTEISHKAIEAPSFLPTWLFAYNYPHNVNRVGIPLSNCEGEYCAVLPMPVFPTPVYEFFAGVLLFALLWFIRKRFTLPLSLFSLYLIVNGMERFLVEKIRVNYQYDWGWLHPTQAEIIAVGMILTGIILWFSRKTIHDRIQGNS
jgi:prolipoprotein diacylglyceryltransferase